MGGWDLARIDYYFSTVSPFTYLAGDRLERLAEKRGATINYKPFDLMALFPRTGGVPLPERHPSRVEYRAMDLPRLAKVVGMPFNLKPAYWPVNAAPSSYAIIAADKAGGGDVGALARGILSALWAEERDIADDGTIRSCLEAAGFDPSLADSGLLVGAETYAANTEAAVAAGVFGSPFYITEDGERFWGQDRLDHLDLHLGGEI